MQVPGPFAHALTKKGIPGIPTVQPLGESRSVTSRVAIFKSRGSLVLNRGRETF